MTERTPTYASNAWIAAQAIQPWPDERRDPEKHATRAALLRLRIVEFKSADYLPPDLMQEFTQAIDGVVNLVRGAQ